MELIDRYIYAVTKRLPQKQRDDIEKELRSLIDDMVSERCGENPPQKQDIESILNELGNPSKLAAKYRDEKGYLIGPDYFYTYLFVLKIVMAATAFGLFVSSLVDLFGNPPVSIGEGFGKVISSVISGAFEGFTWVTVIFAVIERCSKNIPSHFLKRDWSVSELPEIPDKKELIKPAESIVGIVFSVLSFVILGFASGLFSVFSFNGKDLAVRIPVFSEQGLKNLMPLLIALLVVSILKESIKLITGKWNYITGISSVVLNVISLTICFYIFADPSVWNADFVRELSASGMAPSDLDVSLDVIWYEITHRFIYIIAFGMTVDSIVSLIKGIKYGSRFRG